MKREDMKRKLLAEEAEGTSRGKTRGKVRSSKRSTREEGRCERRGDDVQNEATEAERRLQCRPIHESHFDALCRAILLTLFPTNSPRLLDYT